MARNNPFDDFDESGGGLSSITRNNNMKWVAVFALGIIMIIVCGLLTFSQPPVEDTTSFDFLDLSSYGRYVPQILAGVGLVIAGVSVKKMRSGR